MKVFGFWLDEIAFACAAGFLAGTAAAFAGISLAVVTGVGAIMAFGVLIAFRCLGIWKFVALIGAVAVFGFWYFHLYQAIVLKETHLIFNQNISFEAIVNDGPKISASGKYLVVSADAMPPFAAGITVLAPPSAAIIYGDRLNLEGKILPPDLPGDGPVIIPASMGIIAHAQGFWLWQKLYDFRRACIRGISAIVPPSAAGFLAAIAFNAKDVPTGDVSAAMASSGTSFLVTLYGMKISLIMFAVMNMFLGYINRRMAVALAAVSGLLFVLMSGTPAAAIRAAIMACIALIARESGGTLLKRNALIVAAAIMVFWNPTAIGDTGFLASFGSVAGIMYLAPALTKIFRFENTGFLAWKENFVMNLAAQLAILPLIVDPATGFPLISFVSGAVLIMFLPLTMAFGWLAGISGAIANPFSFLTGQFAAAIAAIQLGIIRFFAAVSFTVPLPFNAWTVGIYYALLIFFIASQRKKIKR